MTVLTALAGRLPDGRDVRAHTLDAGGPVLRVLELGATVDSLVVADRDGRPRDIVLSPPSLEDRLANGAYLGSTVGRYANRIAGGSFELDGRRHRVPPNEGPHALHGGPDGFDRRVWRTVSTADSAMTSSVCLELVSPDGDQGFPGELTVEVTFAVDDRSVTIDYLARTTAPTVVNLTNHSYVNLDGPASETIDEHLLSVEADVYTPVGPDLIPLGPSRAVACSAFDLTTATRIGDRVRMPDEQVLLAHGIDHHFDVRGTGMRRHATVLSAESGIELTVRSDQPGIQVYTGNFLDGTLVGRHGRTYRQGAGIALETQHAPDSPNRPELPSTVLRPGETHTSRTVWELETR